MILIRLSNYNFASKTSADLRFSHYQTDEVTYLHTENGIYFPCSFITKPYSSVRSTPVAILYLEDLKMQCSDVKLFCLSVVPLKIHHISTLRYFHAALHLLGVVIHQKICEIGKLCKYTQKKGCRRRKAQFLC